MPLTLPDVRARVETDLDDITLQRILDAAVEEIDRSAGDGTSASELFVCPRVPVISTQRPATTITTIVERLTAASDPVTLATSDYRALDAWHLRRLTSGANPASYWGDEVVVTYAPGVSPMLRDRVTLDLVQLDVDFRAYDDESVGEWSGDQSGYADRRRALLSQIREGTSLVV